jgi:catechol 2,3-dioxygenase
MDKTYQIPAGTRIGHIHLKVSDLNKSLDFYCGLLGFAIRQRLSQQVDIIIILALIPGIVKVHLLRQ